jgi:uncharacterized membrane protein
MGRHEEPYPLVLKYALPGIGFGILGGYLLSRFALWSIILAALAFVVCIGFMALSVRDAKRARQAEQTSVI